MSRFRLLQTFTVALLGLHFWSLPSFAPDGESLGNLDKFLAEGSFALVRNGAYPQIFPGGHDEKYLVQGADGHFYKLRLKGTLPLYGEIGTAALGSLLGLPGGLVYPALVKRGRDGFPSPEVARELNPAAWGTGSIGNHPDWIPASLQRVRTLQPWDPSSFNEAQLAQYFGQLVLNFVVGNNDFNPGDNIANVEWTIATLDATQAFRFYSREGQKKLGEFLSRFPGNRVRSLSQPQVGRFAALLNGYLSRLENVSEEDLRKLFDPYLSQMERRERHFDHFQELKRRTRVVRAEAIAYCASAMFPHSVARVLATPFSVPAVTVTLPTLALGDRFVPSLQGHPPKEVLWAYYFRSFWRARQDAERAWGDELGISSDDTIPHLLALAKTAPQEKCGQRVSAVTPPPR